MRFKNTVKARRQRSGHGEGVATAGLPARRRRNRSDGYFQTVPWQHRRCQSQARGRPRAPSVAQSSCIGDGDPTGEAYGTCKRDRELRPLRGSEGQPCPAAPQLLMSPRSWHLGFQKLLGS